MKVENIEEMKAVVAYMRIGEDVAQYAAMQLGDSGDDIIDSTVLYMIKKAGIKIDDVEKFHKQVAYYYVDGQYDIDHSVLDGVKFQDVEETFEELNLL